MRCQEILGLRFDETEHARNAGYDPILQMRKLKPREAPLSKVGFEPGLSDSITSPLGEL